jgi:hypothetical protein
MLEKIKKILRFFFCCALAREVFKPSGHFIAQGIVPLLYALMAYCLDSVGELYTRFA